MNNESPYATVLVGAVGAVIALALNGYIAHRKAVYKRSLKHNDSLVTLELRLLDIDAALHDNKIRFHQIVKGALRKQLMIARPVTLPLEDSFFKDSYSLELNNKLFSYRYDLRRINSDIENFNKNYGLIGDAMMLGQIDPTIFSQNLSGLLIEQDKLMQGFNDLQEKTVAMLAYVRVRIRKDPKLLTRYRYWWIKRTLKNVSGEEVAAEIKKHMRDIDNSQREK